MRPSIHRIRINLEDILVESRVDPNDVPHLVIYLQLERRHGRIKVHPVEILQQQDLRVPLAPVPRLGRLGRLAHLDDHDVPGGQLCPTSSKT